MKIRIGGQAVSDGVMMRSDNYISTAVRTSKGKISVRTREYHSITESNKFLGLPFIRGIVTLFELMGLGLKEMMWASNKNMKKEERLSKKEIIFAIVLSIVIALVIFKLIPWALANFVSKIFGPLGIWLNVIDAVFKILILIGYFSLLGLSKEIGDLFGYHGAEHKTVSCYEKKLKLTPQNAAKCSRIHPRCGTTFVFIVFLVGIFFYVLIPPATGFWLNYLIRILLLPLIAGVAYELIRLEGKYSNNRFVKWIIWPGLQFQRLTTKNPSKKQIEVAIVALSACIQKEEIRFKLSAKKVK
ncbi:MAG: DUF1385 domain-containing protein [Candidatus Woesearchaeota archaeon]|jgi:uncharacterized protein YqhQ